MKREEVTTTDLNLHAGKGTVIDGEYHGSDRDSGLSLEYQAQWLVLHIGTAEFTLFTRKIDAQGKINSGNKLMELGQAMKDQGVYEQQREEA